MGRRWTEENIQALKGMAKRYRVPEIAEKLDRTVGGVTFKAHTLKLSLRRPPSYHSVDQSSDMSSPT